jgi:hypothetical protein
MAEKTTAPGKVTITFTDFYCGHDFDPVCTTYKAGATLEVDAEKATTLAKEMGRGCPFEITKANKAVGEAPTTK